LSALLPLLLVLAGATPQVEAPTQELARAVQLFESFKDQTAAMLLRDVLLRAPAASIAAKAHVYLGLIALNATDAEEAEAEFRKAIAAYVLVELPPNPSPKAQVLFTEARRELAAAAPLPEVARPSPASPPPVVVERPSAPAPASPSPLPAYVVGGGGIAALAVGGVFGYLQQSAASEVQRDAALSAALADGQPYARDGITADVLYCAGGAALLVAIILFATERAAPAISASAGPGGLSISGAF
jgi:hypothetical protein